MKIAFIIDPPEKVNKQKDTSYFLMMAAFERGHDVYFFDQDTLVYDRGEVLADLKRVEDFSLWPENHKEIKTFDRKLAEMDVIFVRKEPPFDRRYFYSTLLLDLLPESVKVVNRPQALRDWNEKLSALFFQRFCPPTLISQREDEIQGFCRGFDKVVFKPIDGYGGRGIHLVESQDVDRELMAKVTHQGSHKVVVQKFVEEANEGDKRIILFRGEPLGALLRKAEKPGALNNLDQGAKPLPSELTEHEKSLCQEMKPFFLKSGLEFVGIDLLGPYLTEINVTSPTGLQEISRYAKVDFHHQIIEAYE